MPRVITGMLRSVVLMYGAAGSALSTRSALFWSLLCGGGERQIGRRIILWTISRKDGVSTCFTAAIIYTDLLRTADSRVSSPPSPPPLSYLLFLAGDRERKIKKKMEVVPPPPPSPQDNMRERGVEREKGGGGGKSERERERV